MPLRIAFGVGPLRYSSRPLGRGTGKAAGGLVSGFVVLCVAMVKLVLWCYALIAWGTALACTPITAAVGAKMHGKPWREELTAHTSAVNGFARRMSRRTT